MQIKQIKIDADDIALNLDSHHLKSDLNGIYTDPQQAPHLANRIHSILVDLLCGSENLKRQGYHFTAEAIVAGQESELAHRLICNQDQFIQSIAQPSDHDRRNPVDATELNSGATVGLNRRCVLFESNPYDLESMIRYYESTLKHGNSGSKNLASAKQDLDNARILINPSANRHQKGKQSLLKSRLVEVDSEIAERSELQQDLPILLARREHLNKRLAEPAPPTRAISETRECEIQRQRQTLQSELRKLRKEKDVAKRQLSNIELDIQRCRLGTSDLDSGRIDIELAKYQNLCDMRDRTVHELSRIDRTYNAAEAKNKLITGKLKQLNSNTEPLTSSQASHLKEQQSIRAEIQRISKKIQNVERINWLENNQRNLLKQLKEHSSNDDLHRLMERATWWMQRLIGDGSANLRIQTQRQPTKTYPFPDDFNVLINDTDEAKATPRQWHLADLAIRMAFAEEIQDTATQTPLIIRLPLANDFKESAARASSPRFFTGCDSAPNSHPELHSRENDKQIHQQIIQTLSEFTTQGIQIIILTADLETARMIQSAGGSLYQVPSPTQSIHSETATISVQESPSQACDQFASKKSTSGKASTKDVASDRSSATIIDHDDTLKHTADRPAPKTMQLKSETNIANVVMLTPRLVNQLVAHGVLTVEALIELPDERLSSIAENQEEDLSILHETRSICEMICKTPKLTLFDAKLLMGAGICSANELRQCTPQDLVTRTERFLVTPKGQACLSEGNPDQLCRLLTWLATAHLKESSESTIQFPRIRSPQSLDGTMETNDVIPSKRSTHARSNPTKNARNLRSKSETSALRSPRETKQQESSMPTLLKPDSDLIHCPILDQTCARRFREVGYRTINEFLIASPQVLANEIGTPKLHPKTISSWQEQIKLCVTIRDLDPEHARLLVLAGFDCLEVIANSDSETLSDDLKRFCKSTRGKRQIRGVAIPSADMISQWILDCKLNSQQRAA